MIDPLLVFAIQMVILGILFVLIGIGAALLAGEIAFGIECFWYHRLEKRLDGLGETTMRKPYDDGGN